VHAHVRNGVAAAALIVVAVLVFVVPRFRSATVDPIPERTDVQEVCRIDGKWLTPHGPGNHPLAGPAARFALLTANETNWLLDATDCTLREVKLSPASAAGRVEAVTVSDLEVLFVVTGQSDLPVELIRLDLVTGEQTRSPLPQRTEEAVHLQFSRDGSRAVWITDFGTDDERVHGAPVGQQSEFSFAPRARLGLGPHHLIDVGRNGRDVLLQRDRGEYLLVDRSGLPIRTLRTDDGIQPFGADIRFAPGGDAYLGWDNYSDERPRSIVQWRIADRIVRKDLPAESRVVSAAASSNWNWIAASIQANTKSGRGVESLTVWSADGNVRFHKRLRAGARTPVVFLDGDLVAYNEVDSTWHAATRVVRLTRIATTSGSD